MARSLPFILILVLSFFTWRPLLSPGYFSMHDNQQVVRLQQLDESLRAGQFPVRWVADLGFGYGYPLFNFYPPLVYYLGEAFHLLGLSLINSIKLVWFVAIFASGLAMYFLAREFSGKLGGIVAAVFYVYAPYHAVDAYVRGALAELFSFVWLPLILLFSYKRKLVLTGVFLGLLMLTHNLVFLPFAGIFLLWNLFLGKREFLFSVLFLIFSFLLTAFFWLPALAEKQFTLVDQLLIKNLASYRIHFLCPRQLWWSPWGYGGSVAGCADGVSFALGKVYFFVIVLSLLLVLVKKSKVIFLSLALLAFSMWMTTDYSRIVWDNVSQLWYLQFPWRFLEFVALFTSFLAGASLLLAPQKGRLVVAGLLITAVIFFNAKYFQPQRYLTEATDASLTSEGQVKWAVSSSSFEYLPVGVATKLNELGVVWLDIDQTQIQNSKFKVQNGNASINYWKPDSFLVTGRFDNDAVFQPQVTNFPGWKIWVDGKEKRFRDDNKYKLITVDVPDGEHTITGMFTNTWPRMVGNLVSSISILGLIIYGARGSKT